MKKYIGIAISIVLLILALYKANFAQIGRALTGVKLDWIILAVLLYPINLIPRTLRWQLLLQPVKSLQFISILPVLTIGYMANNVLPLRMGEIFRAHLLKEREGVSGTSSIATIIVERVFDGLTLVLVLAVVLVLFPQKKWVHNVGWIAGVIYLTAIIGIFVVRRYEGQILFMPLISRLRDKTPGKWLSDKFEAFLIGLRGINSLGNFTVVGLLSLLIWLIEGVVLYLVTQAFSLSLSFADLALLLAIINFSTMVPSGPGFIGTFQYAWVLSFGLFGINKELAIAASIITQLVFFIVVNPVGIGLLLKYNLSLRRVDEV